MSKRLEALRRQFVEITDGIDAIHKRAETEKRDLTTDEETELTTLHTRADQLKPEVEAEATRTESVNATAAILARLGATPEHRRSEPEHKRDDAAPAMTVGEYCSLVIRSKQGDADAGELLKREVAEQLLADNAGIVPVSILGPVLKLADSSRPVFASLTSRPMPSAGKTFSRPRVTQRVLVGEQAAELDELASRKMTIVGEAVTKRTFGGVLEISEQDVDWTDPGILQIAIDDFVDYYAEVTELAACTALSALATGAGVWDPTDVGTYVESITAGIQQVYTSARRMPDRIWLSLDEMLAIAGTTNDDDSVTAFSLIKQALGDAGVPMTFVTGPQLPVNTRIIGVSGLVEGYEQQKGLISAPDVSHLGVVMAYRGYVAFYGRAEGFARLVGADDPS